MMMATINNERGILTLDFIFASMVVLSFSAIIFSFSMTLSMVEVVQYISFSTARNYSLAHLNESEQQRRAQEKFQELSTNPIFSSLLTVGWFIIKDAEIGDHHNEFNISYDDSDLFYGARIPFSAPILYKRIPMVGTTASDPDQFTANVQSFLGREPTFTECQQFMNQRAQQFSNLATSGSPYVVTPTDFAIIMDNGC